MTPYLQMDAEVSECGLYRYWLARRLSTIRKCVGFARRWGFDWLYMLNVCAFRSTDVRALKRADDPIGPLNWDRLAALMGQCEVVVAAWGRSTKLPNATARTYASRILTRGETRCLGQNDDGSPKHPLYIPYEQPLMYLRTPPAPGSPR